MSFWQPIFEAYNLPLPQGITTNTIIDVKKWIEAFKKTKNSKDKATNIINKVKENHSIKLIPYNKKLLPLLTFKTLIIESGIPLPRTIGSTDVVDAQYVYKIIVEHSRFGGYEVQHFLGEND